METDLELLNAAKGMDKEALVKIFDLYASPLFNYALRLCRDPVTADHIVGDVFAKLLDQFAAGNGPTSHLRSYLYTTAYHLIVDSARAAHRWAPLDEFRPELHYRLPDIEEKTRIEMILKAIHDDLTEDQRHVILLRFVEDFSLSEIAAILGKEADHVKVIQSRALAKLRKVMEANERRAAMSLSGTTQQSRLLESQAVSL
jgi:RNA polymerase sigma-70 factor (ECF subfamily)